MVYIGQENRDDGAVENTQFANYICLFDQISEHCII